MPEPALTLSAPNQVYAPPEGLRAALSGNVGEAVSVTTWYPLTGCNPGERALSLHTTQHTHTHAHLLYPHRTHQEVASLTGKAEVVSGGWRRCQVKTHEWILYPAALSEVLEFN